MFFIAIILAGFSSSAEAGRRISTEELIVRSQMETAILNETAVQQKIDLARTRCERNGGTFDMSQVEVTDESDIRRRDRSRPDRDSVYRSGRTINVNLGRMIFGPKPPETDVEMRYRSNVSIPAGACYYKPIDKR